MNEQNYINRFSKIHLSIFWRLKKLCCTFAEVRLQGYVCGGTFAGVPLQGYLCGATFAGVYLRGYLCGGTFA